MTSPPEPRRAGWERLVLARWLAVGMGLALTACAATPSASPSRPGLTPSPSATSTQTTGTPAPTPEPPLSLTLPQRRDQRVVSVRVQPSVARDSDGQIVVTIENRTDRRIGELVVRWPTALRDTLFLAPFEPSEQRIREFGPPLHQDWTKWVDGPGERGEPAGTTSLGWGPLLPNATLRIPILATRRAAGDVAFDLQVLAGESVLALPDGSPAELRVSVP